MIYATQQNMIDRFGQEELIQRTDRDQLGVIDTVVLTQALNDAAALIDGYLRAAYTLPLATVPAELVLVCCNLARFYLYDDGAIEVVQKRRDEAISWLKDVSAKRVSLGADSGGNPAPAASGGVSIVAAARVFDAVSLKDY